MYNESILFHHGSQWQGTKQSIEERANSVAKNGRTVFMLYFGSKTIGDGQRCTARKGDSLGKGKDAVLLDRNQLCKSAKVGQGNYPVAYRPA